MSATSLPKNKSQPHHSPQNEHVQRNSKKPTNGLPKAMMQPLDQDVGVLTIRVCRIDVQYDFMSKNKTFPQKPPKSFSQGRFILKKIFPNPPLTLGLHILFHLMPTHVSHHVLLSISPYRTSYYIIYHKIFLILEYNRKNVHAHAKHICKNVA